MKTMTGLAFLVSILSLPLPAAAESPEVFDVPFEIVPGESREVTVLHDGRQLKLATIVLRGGTELPTHAAPVPTTILVLEGRGAIHVDGREVTARPGTILVLPPGAEHDVVPEAGTDMSLLVHYLRAAGTPG